LKYTLDKGIVKYYIGVSASFGYLSQKQNYKYSGDLHLQKQVGLKRRETPVINLLCAWSLVLLQVQIVCCWRDRTWDQNWKSWVERDLNARLIPGLWKGVLIPDSFRDLGSVWTKHLNVITGVSISRSS